MRASLPPSADRKRRVRYRPPTERPSWVTASNSAARVRRPRLTDAAAAGSGAWLTLCRKALATLCAPPLQHRTAGAGAHALAEAVGLGALAGVGLVGAFHGGALKYRAAPAPPSQQSEHGTPRRRRQRIFLWIRTGETVVPSPQTARKPRGLPCRPPHTASFHICGRSCGCLQKPLQTPRSAAKGRVFRPCCARAPSRVTLALLMPADHTASATWDSISQRLREMLNAGIYSTWFSQVYALEQDADRLVVGVPNEFTKTWIEGHFGSLLDAAASEHELVVELRVAVAEAVAAARTSSDAAAIPEVVEVEPEEPAAPESALRSGINPRYTFDVFVIGGSNRFAHAAALAVAEAPAQSYNPLFIYGSTGLGKTHLLQAIGHYVLQQHDSLNVRYVTTETVLNEFVDSMRDGRMVNFKQRYRTYDVLLIDDIQFIEGKERLQEEFFHTFNSLYEAGKQIVLSSARPPHELATLESRLRSRFQWGLITDVTPPDLETRIAILRKKVMTERFQIDDSLMLTYIADRVTTNIRELEGALTRVVAYASLTGRPISTELAEEVLRNLFPQGAARSITIEQIQSAVCEWFHISLGELRGDKRSQAIVFPRQVAMYLARELTDSSLPKIGARFGGRDHTTVLHAVSKITRLLKEDREAFNLVQELTTRIKQSR